MSKNKISVREKVHGGLYPVTLDVAWKDPEIISISLKNIIEKYSSRYDNLMFEPVIDCGCRYDCSCTPTFYLYGSRLETDEEFLKRTDKIAHERFLLEEKERKEFERLKKKFGDQCE